MSKRRLVITRHAIDRLVARDGHLAATALEAEQLIEREVREALEAGRVQNHKSAPFVLYGERRRQLPPGERFLWNEDETLAWIVRRRSDEDVVTTSLTRGIA